jgi:hypothetical protein
MKTIQHRCPVCSKLNQLVPKAGDYLGMIYCSCGNSFFANAETRVEIGGRNKTIQQRRSQDQEHRASKRDGARIQPASGAMDHAKGDLRIRGLYLKECKCTTRESFAIRRDVLDKVGSEASMGEVPVLEIEFQETFPKKRFYVLPEWAFEEYMEMKRKCL